MTDRYNYLVKCKTTFCNTKVFFKKEKRFFCVNLKVCKCFWKPRLYGLVGIHSACVRITTFVDMSYYIDIYTMYLPICFWLLHLPVREVWKSWGNSSKRTDNSRASSLQEMMGTPRVIFQQEPLDGSTTKFLTRLQKIHKHY